MTADVAMASADESAGLTSYYEQKIEHLELTVRDETQNLRRLQAQRNELNSKGKIDRYLLLLLFFSFFIFLYKVIGFLFLSFLYQL